MAAGHFDMVANPSLVTVQNHYSAYSIIPNVNAGVWHVHAHIIILNDLQNRYT
jgi:hypothetical protein